MGIKIEGVRVDINKYGPASGAHDRAGGGEKAEGSRDHAVAGVHSHGSEREPKRIGAGCATDRLRGAGEGGQFAFERLDFRPENEMLRGADPFHSGQNLFADGGVLAAEAKESSSGNSRAAICFPNFMIYCTTFTVIPGRSGLAFVEPSAI